MCVQCGYCTHRVWVPWLSFCFPSLTGTCSWKRVQIQYGSMKKLPVLMYGWAQSCGSSENPNSYKPSLLPSPHWASEAPLYPSDLFFIFAHAGSGDVPNAFSKFPVGIYVTQERIAPWQMFGDYSRALDCSWKLFSQCSSFLADSTYQNQYGSCSVQGC